MQIEFRNRKYIAIDENGKVLIMSHNKNCVIAYLRQLGYVI